MLVYIWSRRNPQVRMSFLGILNFNAPYLPWVLLGFTILLNKIWPAGDILGLIIGHIYYFLEDVYPKLFNLPLTYHILGAPKFVKKAFDYLMRDAQDANIIDDDDIDNIDSDSDQEDLNTPSTTTIHNEGGFVLGNGETLDENNLEDKKKEDESLTTPVEEAKGDEFISNTETNASQPNVSSEGLKKRTFVPDFNPSSEPGGYNWNSSTEATSTSNTEDKKDN